MMVALLKDFPEGIPAWMTDRGMSESEIREAMNLRRAAFPATTAPVKSKKVPTPSTLQGKIEAVMMTDWISSLYARWQDEKDYEDINEYGKVFAKNTGWEVIKSSKRPFGFTFKIPEFPEAVYEIKISARTASWKRVG